MEISVIKSPPRGMTCSDGLSHQEIAELLKAIASPAELTAPWVNYGGISYYYGDRLQQSDDYWVPIAQDVGDGYIELSGIIRYRLGTCGYCGEPEGKMVGYQECSNCGGA